MPLDKSIIAKRSEIKRRAMDGFLSTHRDEPMERIKEPIRQKNQFFLFALIIGITIIFISGSTFFITRSLNSTAQENNLPITSNATNINSWHSIKLMDGEIIYGKISDINQDPMIVNPVYYNYDQKNDNLDNRISNVNEAGDLRLVKRGAETHGPDGMIKIFRSQTVFLENLRPDSKVLKVIQENEYGK